MLTNDLKSYRNIFDGLRPWSGQVPKGYLVDFLGIFTDGKFRDRFEVDPNAIGGTYIDTTFPPQDGSKFPMLEGNSGERWFEVVNWIVAAREAKERYVMMTLGACYGAQAVGACAALRRVNPMPYKLVAVEPNPPNVEWLEQHMRNNGIDPGEQWLLPMVVSDCASPVLFYTGPAGWGASNCYFAHIPSERQKLFDTIIADSRAKEALRDLLLHNSTGITKTLPWKTEPVAELKSVSAITLRELLAPFDFVDYVEADMQQSEILVFPPHMDLLRKKVRRIHIGTHGDEVHQSLRDLFEGCGWTIVFDYGPNKTHNSDLGQFGTVDGILTVRNPDL